MSSVLQSLILPLFLVLPLGIGMALPQLDVINRSPLGATQIFLVVLIFFSALKTDPVRLLPQKVHLRLLAAQFLLGIGPWALVRLLLPQEKTLALMFFFTGIAPTAAVATAVAGMLRERLGFTLTGFLVSNVGISLGMIGLLPLVTGCFSFVFLKSVCRTLVLLVGLPMAAGLILHCCWPATRAWPGRCALLLKGVWVYALLGAGAAAGTALAAAPERSYLAVGLALGISFLFIWLSLWTGVALAPRRLRSECGQLLWQKNTFFVIALILAYSEPIVILSPIFYTMWNNVFNGYLLYRDSRRIAKRRKTGALLR